MNSLQKDKMDKWTKGQMVTQFFYRNHAGFFGLPLLLAEEAAKEGEEDVEGIEELKQKSHVPRGAWFFICHLTFDI